MAFYNADLHHTICLDVGSTSPYLEMESGTATPIRPGYLLHQQLETEKVTISTLGEPRPEKLFAVENPYSGKTVSDTYAQDERVMLRICRPGDVVFGWLSELEVGALSAGDFFMDGGNGGLVVAPVVPVSPDDNYVAVCLEDSDPFGGGLRLVKIRVM